MCVQLPDGQGVMEVIVAEKLNFGEEGDTRKGTPSKLAQPLSSPAWPKPRYADRFEGAVIGKQVRGHTVH